MSEVVLYKTDGTVETLDHVGGSVTADRGSAVRRTCTVQLADTSLIPRTPADKLSVYGAYVTVSRGIEYAPGDRELVPLGRFRIDEVEGDVDQGPTTLTGSSFEAFLADDKFVTPVSTRGYALVSNAVGLLVSTSMPSLVVDTTRLVDTTVGVTTWDVEGDRLEAIKEVARAAGCEAYCSADGALVIAPLPDPLLTLPAWEIAAGERGAMIEASRGMTSQNVYNAVLARGENTEADTPAVSSLVVDDDPTSPTRWGGPFGRRPKFISSSTLTSTGACFSAATYELAAAKSPNATADLSSLPNPALEPGDVVRAVYADGTRDLLQVQSLTISLEASGSFDLAFIAAKEDA
ncbi:DUF5047 domain-containing protein [Streptomyces sp. NPDC054784]